MKFNEGQKREIGFGSHSYIFGGNYLLSTNEEEICITFDCWLL